MPIANFAVGIDVTERSKQSVTHAIAPLDVIHRGEPLNQWMETTPIRNDPREAETRARVRQDVDENGASGLGEDRELFRVVLLRSPRAKVTEPLAWHRDRVASAGLIHQVARADRGGIGTPVTLVKDSGRLTARADWPRMRVPMASRRPYSSPDGGRDHWPNVMSVLLAGGGLKMGQVVGSTTSKGEELKSGRYQVKNVLATVYHAPGVDAALTYTDRTGRPQHLLDEREPIKDLL